MAYLIRRVNVQPPGGLLEVEPIYELWMRSGEATSRLPRVTRWLPPFIKPILAGLYQQV